MTVEIQWDEDAPITGQPDAGSDSKVYTVAGAATVTITDEAIGGDSITLNFTVPLSLTNVESTPDTVDSSGDAASRTITIAGEGFPANTGGTVALATGAPGAYGTTVVSTGATTNAAGIFTGAVLVVPLDTDAGDYHLEVSFAAVADLQTAITITNAGLVAPTGLASPSQTATAVNLTWNAVPDAEEYVVRWAPTGTETWTEVAPVAVTNGSVTGLTASTTYDFQVKATAVGMTDSSWSTTLTQATTAQPALDPPANPAAGTPTTDTIPFSWDAVTDADTYTVGWRAAPSGEWTEITGIETTSQDVTGLDPLTDYELRVKAVGDGFTDSDWSTVVEATTAPLGTLDAPTGIASPAQTATTIDLTWDAVDDATSYGIERSPAGTGTWTEVQTAVSNSATVTGMTASTSYDFRLAARADGWTASDWSTTFTQATTA